MSTWASGWIVTKPLGPGGPGYKVRTRLFGFAYEWVAWTGENAHAASYEVYTGWASNLFRAEANARHSIGLDA